MQRSDCLLTHFVLEINKILYNFLVLLFQLLGLLLVDLGQPHPFVYALFHHRTGHFALDPVEYNVAGSRLVRGGYVLDNTRLYMSK